MKNLLKLLFAGVLLMTTLEMNAEKLGYINSQELLSLMPESKAAQKKIEAKAKEFESQMKDLEGQYQKLFQEYVNAMEKGTLSDDARKTKEESLQSMQTKIKSYQAQAQKDMSKMQTETLSPIFDKANKAIQKVGAANGFTYVFDTSARSIVYVDPTSENIINLVKKELGIN